MYPKSFQQTKAFKNYKIKSFFSGLKLLFSLKHNVARRHLKQGFPCKDGQHPNQCDYTCVNLFLTLTKEMLPFIHSHFCMLR